MILFFSNVVIFNNYYWTVEHDKLLIFIVQRDMEFTKEIQLLNIIIHCYLTIELKIQKIRKHNSWTFGRRISINVLIKLFFRYIMETNEIKITLLERIEHLNYLILIKIILFRKTKTHGPFPCGSVQILNLQQAFSR